MKKSSFITLILGTVSTMLFAIGMCMALIPEWNAFKPGVVFGVVGLILGIATVIVWRKMNHKAPVKFSGKNLLCVIVGIIGTLFLGIGMCFCMVWEKMVFGIVIGVIGIIILLCLIPLVKGFKE